MRIRAGAPDDAAELTRVALAAKAHWGYPARWLELWRDALTIAPEFVAAHPVFVAERAAEAGGGVAGWSALVPPAPGTADPGQWTLEHLWVLPHARRRGVGRALLDELVDRARALGGQELVLDTHRSLDAAAALYAALGFSPIEPYNDNPNATTWLGRAL